MNDELRQIEIETARIKLERERLALEDELRRRQRSKEAKNVATNVADAAKGLGTLKGLVKLAAWGFAAYILFLLITT